MTLISKSPELNISNQKQTVLQVTVSEESRSYYKYVDNIGKILASDVAMLKEALEQLQTNSLSHIDQIEKKINDQLHNQNNKLQEIKNQIQNQFQNDINQLKNQLENEINEIKLNNSKIQLFSNDIINIQRQFKDQILELDQRIKIIERGLNERYHQELQTEKEKQQLYQEEKMKQMKQQLEKDNMIEKE